MSACAEGVLAYLTVVVARTLAGVRVSVVECCLSAACLSLLAARGLVTPRQAVAALLTVAAAQIAVVGWALSVVTLTALTADLALGHARKRATDAERVAAPRKPEPTNPRPPKKREGHHEDEPHVKPMATIDLLIDIATPKAPGRSR